MLSLQVLDTIKFVNKLSLNFACNTSKDGRISIITEEGILIYTLTNYVDNTFSDMAFKKKFIKLPEPSFSVNLKVNFENFYEQIPKDDLYEKLLRIDCTNRLENSAQIDVRPVQVKWSPVGLSEGSGGCLLGVLTNFYELLIYERRLNEGGIEEYECIVNLHRVIVKKFGENWENINSIEKNDEWEHRISMTKPTAFEWSHLTENYAILFISHPNNSISSWKFEQMNQKNNSHEIIFLGKYESVHGDINILYWHPGTIEYGGILCYGNTEGQLSVISVNYSKNMEFSDEMKFYSQQDEKKIEFLHILEYNSIFFLIGVKEEFMFIYGINQNGEVFDELTLDSGNLHITAFCHYQKNIVLISTISTLKKITIDVIDRKISIKIDNVPIKFDNTKLKIHGMILSENRIFLGILTYPCRYKNVARENAPSNFIIFYDNSMSPLKIITENTHEVLGKFFDCFEVLRLLSYKNKVFPWEGIEDNLNYDNLTLTQLKSLRWISKLSEKVYDVIPSIVQYKIKPYILLHYMVSMKLSVNRMKKLMKSKNLTEFQLMSIDIQNMFLKEMVVMKILEKSRVGEKFLDNLIEVIEKANELEYPDMPPCFWCGEKIIGPTCIPPHAESRCSISMMPIFPVPGYKCTHCGCVAHREISNEYSNFVMCEYCEVPMDKIYTETNFEVNHIEKNTPVEEEIPPDSAVEYSALSDSDDDELTLMEKSSYLREKFFNVLETNNLHKEIVDNENLRENNSDYSLDEGSDDENK